MVSFAALPLLPLVCQIVLSPNNPGIIIGSTAVPPQVLTLTLCLFIPILLCGLFGTGMGKFDYWGKEEIAPQTDMLKTIQFKANK